jgi:uncharacterized cupredoxin-like copper-binding protein
MRRSSQGRYGGRLLTGLLAIVVLGSTACSLTGAIRNGLPVMKVSERDFRIKAPRYIRAGELRLQVGNQGPGTHELLVVRFAGAHLPLRPDGFTVNEGALESVTAVTFEGSEPGGHREAVVQLAPGRYVLFCNMAGHYLGGMHTTVIVR